MVKLPSVLLVDDDPTTNFLNQALLQRLDVVERVLVAQDGNQALALLQQHCSPPMPTCPVLILLDVNMPGMNGIEFLAAYHELPKEQRGATIIVMLTSSLHPRDLERVQQFPIAGFLNKPLNTEKMQRVLETHFG